MRIGYNIVLCLEGQVTKRCKARICYGSQMWVVKLEDTLEGPFVISIASPIPRLFVDQASHDERRESYFHARTACTKYTKKKKVCASTLFSASACHKYGAL